MDKETIRAVETNKPRNDYEYGLWLEKVYKDDPGGLIVAKNRMYGVERSLPLSEEVKRGLKPSGWHWWR